MLARSLGISASGEGEVYTNTVEAYTRATGWTMQEEMEMTNPRWRHCSAAIGTVLYVIGGEVEGGESTSVEAWDTSSSTGWEARASLSTGRHLHACHVGEMDGLAGIYVAGGRDESADALSSVEFYFGELDTWSTLAAMTSTRSSGSLTVVNGLMAAAGGYSWHTLETVEVLEEGEWLEIGSLRTTRYFHAAVTIPAGLVNCK